MKILISVLDSLFPENPDEFEDSLITSTTLESTTTDDFTSPTEPPIILETGTWESTTMDSTTTWEYNRENDYTTSDSEGNIN